MQFRALKRLNPANLVDAPKWFIDGAATPLNTFMQNVGDIFTNQINFKDNINCSLLTLSCTHNTELLIANPLKTRPIGVFALNAGTQTVKSAHLNVKTNGQLGITVQYDLAPQYIELGLTADAGAPDPGGTNIVWNKTTNLIGTTLSAGANGVIQVAEAGLYRFDYDQVWTQNSTGSRNGWITVNAVATRHALASGYALAAAGSFWCAITGGTVLSLAANDVVQVIYEKNSGGTLNLLAANSRFRCTQLARIGISDNVQLVLVGG